MVVLLQKEAREREERLEKERQQEEQRRQEQEMRLKMEEEAHKQVRLQMLIISSVISN